MEGGRGIFENEERSSLLHLISRGGRPREGEGALGSELPPHRRRNGEARERAECLLEVSAEEDLLPGPDEPVEPHADHLAEIAAERIAVASRERDPGELGKRLDDDDPGDERLVRKVVLEDRVAGREALRAHDPARRLQLEHVVDEEERGLLRQEPDQVVKRFYHPPKGSR